MQLKHNQKISCVIYRQRIDDARICIIEDGKVYICQNEFDVSACRNKLGYKYSAYVGRVEDEEKIIKYYQITFPEKTWDTLAVGDILTDGYAERKVLAILGDVFLLSDWNNFEVVGVWYTKSEVQKYGWTIKSSSPETIEILGKTYDKKKVEEKLKEIN